MGGSYGGFMTAWVISHYPKMFKSSVVERALLNWESNYGTIVVAIPHSQARSRTSPCSAGPGARGPYCPYPSSACSRRILPPALIL